MGQTLANMLSHVIFSTKNRQRFIDPRIENEIHAYIASVCHSMGAYALKVGGVEDHIHILLTLPRTTSVAQLVEEIKKRSSKWIKTKGPEYRLFSWQRGYGIFSVSPTHKSAVYEYIGMQREHHKTVSYQDEYRRILRKNLVEIDEKYLWD